jgi:hypothetical protein
MFIIFDSSNQIFDRLIKSIKPQQTSNTFNFRNYLHRNMNDRYPTYGMDIPGSCM